MNKIDKIYQTADDRNKFGFVEQYKKVRIGDLTKIRTGKLDANAASDDGKYPFFTCSREPLKISSYTYDCECVLVAGNGDLNVKYYQGKFDAYQRTYIIEKNGEEKLYVPYLYYFMERYIEELRKQAIGGVIKYIKLENLTDALIPLPDIEIQKQIVIKLSKVKGLVEKRKKLCDELDTLIKARFVEMFGDPLAGTEKWSFQTVGDVADSVDPQPSHRTPPVVEGGIPYVSMKDCNYKNGTIDFAGARKVSPDVLVEHHNRYELHNGDFIIGKIGTIGNPIFVPKRDDYALSANVVLIQPNSSKVSPYFLKETFESSFVERQFLDAKNSTSQAAFGIKKVRNIKIMNPDMKTQMEFENFAIQVDKLKVEVQKSLDEMQILFDSLMQEYFG